jgi:hypothetical protein
MRLLLLSLLACTSPLFCSCVNIAGIANAAIRLATVKAIFSCIPEGTRIDTPAGTQLIESLQPGDKVIGYEGETVTILQKHSYAEDPAPERFRQIAFTNGSTVDLCDSHRIAGIQAKELVPGTNLYGLTVETVKIYGGVVRSYDLLTTDSGYRISGVPVNSMIEEMVRAARDGTIQNR